MDDSPGTSPLVLVYESGTIGAKPFHVPLSIGDDDQPRTRKPGAGGAPEIAAGCGEVVVVAAHSRTTFVEQLDFVMRGLVSR